MSGSPGRKPNSRVTPLQGRNSVAELVTRYQNIFDCANPSSADQKTKSWEKNYSKKREGAQPGIDLRISANRDPGVMNKKPREKLALQQGSPPATKTKEVSHRRSDPSSPNMVGHINETSNFHPTKTGKKMETLHPSKIRFEPKVQHLVASSHSINRREGKGMGALAVDDGNSGKKLTPCKRINRAAPSTKLTLAYPALQVNNRE
ncbi:uncharacterized protein LOC116520657 [Thamnophis elegans]|uniref:uncharacterized protein LOC116520657 n=1 Tax=Thamnophis elegans TaxID=35005 RepID=UPI0013780EC9|nr:uncharacterized protein LOC116520657 [Thamnophis elegans]